ncbi:MAG: 4'-phosphopantetheinyl transferase superfamily protein [Ilumatobacteraceae bacterium]
MSDDLARLVESVLAGRVRAVVGRLTLGHTDAGEFGDAAVQVAAELVDPAVLHRLHPAEQHFVARSVPARRNEFAAGRACAHRCLVGIGCDTSVVAIGHRGAPQWPVGVTGSIAHTATLAAAAVVRVATGSLLSSGIGIDLEARGAIDAELWPAILTPAEQSMCAAAGAAADLATVCFSVKEAWFKAQYPATGIELDFLDVGFALDPDGQVTSTGTVRTLGQLDSALPQRGRVAWAVVNGLVVTVAGW